MILFKTKQFWKDKYMQMCINYGAAYKAMQDYKKGYEECRNILNPEQLKIIEKQLKELGIYDYNKL